MDGACRAHASDEELTPRAESFLKNCCSLDEKTLGFYEIQRFITVFT
jgi:hypothetical protein